MRNLSSLIVTLSIFTVQSLFGQNHVYVSGGQTSSPYYTFADENGSDLDLTQLEFHAGETYYFIAAQGFNPHPFEIGSAPGSPSQYSSGGPLSSVGDELVLSIPSDFDPYSESLYFYCTAHTYMSGQFTVVAAFEPDDNGSDPINENNQSEYFVPQSIAGGILTAQDENWSVYNEEINFYDNQTFNAVIENGAESPLNASGSYEYSVNSNGSASLFYTVQSDNETNGYSFAYDLFFSTSNQGTYTKTANYNGETDITTGPFTLILDSSEGDNGNQNDDNETDDESDPVFFLTSTILLELTGEEGLAEGNYAISDDYEWNEETQSEEFGFWIEPAELSDSQDWVYAGGETEDGHLIVENYQNEDLLRQYFDDNQLSEVGYISQLHQDDDELEHDDNDTGNDDNLLDGSVIYITGEDSVNETLIFENGTVTSIFDEGEGQEPFTSEGLSYTIEDEASGYLIIIDGVLHYFFYENNSTGTLFDYSNNGELDESGTWDFTFTITEDDEDEHIHEIFVSGGSMSYPHYSFFNSDGDELDMQDFEFQPDTKYRFIAENLNVSHPFTIGASINGSDIIKFAYFAEPDLPVLEEHNFTGVSEDLEVLGNDLLMPPQEEDFEDDYVLSVNGDYFDFEYSKEFLTAFEEHDLNFYYLCDIHSEMNGRLFLGDDGFYVQENAPDSLGGYEITWEPNDEDEGDDEHIWVYDANGTVSGMEGPDYEYSYEKISENSAKITYNFGSNDPNLPVSIDTLNFTSHEGGTYEMVQYVDTNFSEVSYQESGEFRIRKSLVLENEKYPVFWVTPDLFWELTYYDWEWTSFARFEDPQMGRGAYFAFEDTESAPTYYDPVHGDHEIFESFNLVHVTESIPEGEAPIWNASPDFETYQTQVSPETLEGDHNLTVAGYYTREKMEDFREKVDGFLTEFKASESGNSLEEWVEVRHVEKQNDAINLNRFIYLAELNNEITIFFDQDGDFVHSSSTYYDNWYRNDGIPTEIINSVEAEFPGSEILELWDEVSFLEGTGFISKAIVESNSSELFEIFLNNTGDKVHLVSRFFGQIEKQFPEVAHEYMEQNYRWEDDDTPMYYWTWYDEYQEEFVAVLEDGSGREVRFSKAGEFLREFDPWGPPEEEDAGISFNPNRSAWGTDLTSNNFDGNSTGGDSPAFVRIEKLELGQSDDVNYSTDDPYSVMPPMWGNEEVAYRISLINDQLDEDANLSLSDLELGSTVLPAGTPLKLSFTYESGDPRYLLVSGAKIRGYKHTWPEHWLGRPGSFTILAETTDPVSTTEGDLESTFGIVVVMGGERHYHNSIFQANVPVIDLQPAQQISPYDQVAAFSVSSEVTEDLNVSAFLPRDLLEWNFGISEPHRVKAGLMDNNGTLYFINGSGVDDPDAPTTGGGFSRILHEGYEPDIYFDPYMATGGADPSNEDESAQYKLGDHESDQGFVDEDIEENASARVKQSKFDFNADGYGDSLLEVRFFADVFPADIGFGDPYVEPALVGQVTGRILDEFNNTIPEFGIWFFQAPDGINGPWEPTFFEVDIDYETGEYTAYLPEGEFYAEAWGNDWENDIYFTPQVASSLLIIEEGSSENYDFNLVEEWRPSAHGEIESSLEVNGQVGDEHYDVSIELFPVDENGVRLTEWSAAWLWVEPDGHISGTAPEGRHEVVLYSYDNSIRLSDGPIFWTVVANQVNEFTPLVAQKSLPVRVSGMIRDAEFGEGIWAEVVFVDPNDENIIFWPIWDEFDLAGDVAPEEDSEELVAFAQGLYSVRIPAGLYKIKAVDWSGFYAEQYYTEDGNGTDDFSLASTIEISSELSGIDFNLSAGSISNINIRVLDKNTSEPIPYAWFDFLDAYDEYGPTTFPRVNYSEENGFSLTVSEGSYKLVIGSHEHEPLVLATDVDGNYIWEEGDWSSAAILEISDDLNISLPDALMDGGSLPPPLPPAGDSTISGKVLTGKGVAVPKALVTCHTDDWMFYFEATSLSDGSYELQGLPAGNWIITAYPPYDSSEFTNLQPTEPNWDNPIELGENESVEYKLILAGSNVSGRIMYPKKDENDRVRLKPLPYAWLWAFEDENKTGEPPVYEYGIYLEEPAFNEAYGNTDEDGFFSFSLKEAGKYSMRIEIPGELGSFSLDPIHFEVRDPNQELTLGNAIRLDWTKSEARATTYKVERKSSSSNSYTSVDNNISGSLKSFVDHTIEPGATYEYRVSALSASGSQVLSTDSYKVSKPFIYLAPPSKTIVGKVRNDLNASISGAEVQAWKIDGTGGWASAVTDVNGEYELNVGSGKWEVMVYKPWDRQVNWSYDKAPKQVNFANNGNKVEKKANFIVTTMSGGISGAIEIPTDLSDYYSYIWIDAWNPDGVGNWTNPEADGSFALPLSPGEYTISLWLDPAVFSGYNGPEARVIKVGKSELDLGNIQLVQYVPTVISGIIATADGTPLGNADVWAWSMEGGWAEDVTDSDGSYTLNVSPGTWEIGFNPPMPKDGSASPYLPAPPKRIKIVDSDKALNFTVRKAGAKVKGVVNGTGGSPIADLYAWAYAREVTDENSSDEFNDVVAEVEVSPRGEFSFPAVPGTYAVGLWLFSEEYLFPEEQILTLSEDSVLTDENGTVLEQITFTLSEVSSRVEGVLIDKETNQSIDGLIGEVYAMSLDGQGRQYTVVESNGSYSMLLAPGKWVLEYYIEDDQGRNYPKESVSPVRINLTQGETETANFILSSASATISGAVVYDSNNSAVTESTLYVWAYREDSTAFSAYGNEVETDENGAFSISVLQGGKYEVGVTLSSDLRDDEYFEPTIQKVTMNTSSKNGVVFRLAKPEEDNYISGSVVDELGNPLSGASVYAWTFDGAETAGLTNENGEFNMTVTSGSSWKVGAEYIVFDENDSEIIYLIEEELNANLRVNEYVEGIQLVLNRPAFDIPDGKSVTFDPSKDFITTLPDGTEITIPAGAVNVSSDVDSVRFVVTPTASGLDKSGALKPAGYVYSLELFDNRGKLIEGNFKKDVIIRMPIDFEVIRSQGLNADTLKGTYYSPTKKKWETSKTSTWDKESGILTMTTDHFSPNGPSADALEPVFDIENNTTEIPGADNWYDSDWFGTFYDASVDSSTWFYHTEEKLGWLWIVRDSEESGNYWFYHSGNSDVLSKGWLWTGGDYFIEGDDTKSHFYSSSLGRWLYFHPDYGFYDYEANGGSYLD